MGITKKPTVESIKIEKLPAFEAKLKNRAGYNIKVDINWDTFTAFNKYPLSRLDFVFDDLESFVKKVCFDDMRRKALRDKMSTIKLINSDRNDDLKMELKDNTLSLTVQLVQGAFSSQTDSQIVKYVEALL